MLSLLIPDNDRSLTNATLCLDSANSRQATASARASAIVNHHAAQNSKLEAARRLQRWTAAVHAADLFFFSYYLFLWARIIDTDARYYILYCIWYTVEIRGGPEVQSAAFFFGSSFII